MKMKLQVLLKLLLPLIGLQLLKYKMRRLLQFGNLKSNCVLREYLYSIRNMVEKNRFFERIFAEGSYDEFNAMVDRILHVAVTRYMH